MKAFMLNVTKTYMPPIELYQSYLNEIWNSGQLTNNGNLAGKIKKELIKKLQVSDLELVSNGTVALQLAIKALDIKGDIITTPFSYVATTTSILWENCMPVFVDIDTDNFCINPDLIEQAITEKTSAILATHVYGYPCNVEKIQAIADKYDLKVIYDAAHAFGVQYKGRSILEYGDISTLSFHATKLFHTGEGGAIVSNNKDIINRVNLLKNFGHIGEDNYLSVGINAKMSELHAAMGLCVLPEIDNIIEHRKKCVEYYDYLFTTVKGIYRPKINNDTVYNYAYYPVVFDSYEKLTTIREKLIDNEILPRRYFYPSLNNLPYLQSSFSCPISESICNRVLALPLSAELKDDEIVKVVDVIKLCLQL